MTTPVTGTSTTPAAAGVHGENTAGGDGVVGHGRRGVVGLSEGYQGVYGRSTDNAGVVGESGTPGVPSGLHGVYGVAHNPNGAGTFGLNEAGGQGVQGASTTGIGVWGHSDTGDGVVGNGVRGVVGQSITFQGVYGHSRDNAGVVGESDTFAAVYAVSHGPTAAAVYAHNDRGGPAAMLDGRVTVAGDLDIGGVLNLMGGDIAEHFEVDAAVVAGSVVRIGDCGRVSATSRPYDPAVVGIVAGAPGFRPALQLDGGAGTDRRVAVTLVGKVMCLVDASERPVRAGDFLTSSARPGHAMRASGRRANGAVVGKALGSLSEGLGLVPVLALLR